MKKSIAFIILSSSFLFYACSENKTEQIMPQESQNNNIESVAENKNLRPSTGEKPDLKVFPFFQNGSVTVSYPFYKIPISFKELNIGTANDTGANADTLKVYQKIPNPFFPTIYSYRLLGNFLRTSHIPMGSSWYLNAHVNFPIAWRPTSGKINLVIKADGANRIAELDETNNLSSTIWNIILP